MTKTDEAAVAAPAHTAAVLLLLAGYAVWGWIRVGQLRAAHIPNHLGLYAFMGLSEWVLFAVVMWGSRARDLIGPRWRSPRQPLIDAGIAAAFWVGSGIVLNVLARLFQITSFLRGAQFLLPNGPAERVAWVALSISAGICEETIFRGYLQRQFSAWTRRASAGIVLSAAVFGAGHIYQGFRSSVLIGIYGIMFGLLAQWRKSVRPGMIAHAWQDSVAGLLAGLLQGSSR